MDTLAAVAIGVLLLIFVGSLLALILICRQKYCLRSSDMDMKPILKYHREQQGFEPVHGSGGEDGNDIDDMLQLSPNIEKYLMEHNWVYDANGLVQHCLTILRISRSVTDKLSALTFGANSNQPTSVNQNLMNDVNDATRRVLPRVEDLVRTMGSMRINSGSGSAVNVKNQEQSNHDPNKTHSAHENGPSTSTTSSTSKSTTMHHLSSPAETSSISTLPLAPLLEARAGALVLALNGVIIAFKAAYPRARSDAQWLREAVTEMESHLESLRLAADYVEQAEREKVEIIHMAHPDEPIIVSNRHSSSPTNGGRKSSDSAHYHHPDEPTSSQQSQNSSSVHNTDTFQPKNVGRLPPVVKEMETIADHQAQKMSNTKGCNTTDANQKHQFSTNSLDGHGPAQNHKSAVSNDNNQTSVMMATVNETIVQIQQPSSNSKAA